MMVPWKKARPKQIERNSACLDEFSNISSLNIVHARMRFAFRPSGGSFVDLIAACTA